MRPPKIETFQTVLARLVTDETYSDISCQMIKATAIDVCDRQHWQLDEYRDKVQNLVDNASANQLKQLVSDILNSTGIADSLLIRHNLPHSKS